MLKIYLACPIGPDDAGRAERIERADAATMLLVSKGHCVVAPHLTCHLPIDVLDYEGWMAHGFRLMDGCDALVRVPGESPGADREVARARDMGMQVWTLDEAVRK